MLAKEKVIQSLNQSGGNPGAGHIGSCFPYRDGFIPQFFGEVFPLLGDINANANHSAIDGAAFGIAGKFGENAADFAAIKYDVIGPLNRRAKPLLLQYLANSKPGTAGKQAERSGIEIRAEKIREINALSGRRRKAAAQPAVAMRLAIGHHNGTGRRPLQGQLHPAGIGGIGLFVADNRLPSALRQILFQQIQRHAIGQSGKTITQPGNRFNGIALFPQAAGGLPYGGAGDPQTGTQFFARVVLGAILPQLPQQFGCQISFCHDEVPPFCGRNVNFPLNCGF